MHGLNSGVLILYSSHSNQIFSSRFQKNYVKLRRSRTADTAESANDLPTSPRNSVVLIAAGDISADATPALT
jgi:hypothetical protein